MDKPSPITELLHRTTPTTQGVLERGQFLYRLNRLLKSFIDDNSKLHYQVGNIRDGVLIIYADSTSWASRLRYQTPVLLKQFQQQKGLAELQHIDVKVLPEQQKKQYVRKAELSEEASSCLRACADSVADDALRDVLLRLAAHQNKKD